MSRQLSLAVSLRDAACFDNYYAPAHAQARDCVIAAIRRGVSGPDDTRGAANAETSAYSVIYLWGNQGTGKTHLLFAGCRLATELGRTSVCLSLTDPSLAVDSLEDIEELDLVCLDDLQAIATHGAWQLGVLGLLERVRQRQGTLIVSANSPPHDLGLGMPDLTSRLAGGLVLQLPGLDDEGKIAALKLRAGHRGIEMPDDVVRYVLKRYPRDTRSIFDLLDRVDRASLDAQRRVTIPFIRSIDL